MFKYILQIGRPPNLSCVLVIPSQVFSHIVFVKKLCIVILHLLGHTGSITFFWTPFFYLLKPFTPLLGDTKGVNSANLCLGMWKVTSLLCVDKRWLKHAGVTPSFVWSNFYYRQISRPPTFELWIWCQKLGLYAVYTVVKYRCTFIYGCMCQKACLYCWFPTAAQIQDTRYQCQTDIFIQLFHILTFGNIRAITEGINTSKQWVQITKYYFSLSNFYPLLKSQISTWLPPLYSVKFGWHNKIKLVKKWCSMKKKFALKAYDYMYQLLTTRAHISHWLFISWLNFIARIIDSWL